MKLSGKLVLITGGARGIGLAAAAALLRKGARVALWDVDAAALAAARRTLGDVYSDAVDLTDRAAIAKAAERLRAAAGEPDVLDANAGVVFGGSLLELSDEQVRRTLDVNLGAVIACVREFLPGMLRRGGGRIVLMSSASGLIGVPGLAVYAATKHAVVGLGESLRLELAGSGVGVLLVCPSFVSSGLFAGAQAPALAPWLSPERVASLVVSALERDALYVRAPFSVKLLPLLKALLPTTLADAAARRLGLRDAMAGWTGRKTP